MEEEIDVKRVNDNASFGEEVLGVRVDYVSLGIMHTYTNVWNETKKSCREK